MSSTLKTTHVADALEHLAQQFVGKENIEALLTLMVDQVQELEGVFSDLITDRTLDAAVGAQLDGFGSIVGEDRLGRTDDDYRIAIKLRLLINRCTGTPEEILDVVDLSITGANTVRLTENYPASFRLDLVELLASDAIAVSILSVVNEAKPAGVSSSLIYTLHDDADTFTFSSGDTQEASAAQGWAPDDQSTGGYLAEAAEI